MVNVGDDGDVAQLFDRVCGGHVGTGSVWAKGGALYGRGGVRISLACATAATMRALFFRALPQCLRNKRPVG